MEGSVSEGEAVSSEVENFANSRSSKSALDFACYSSLLALDSACAVKRCCRGLRIFYFGVVSALSLVLRHYKK